MNKHLSVPKQLVDVCRVVAQKGGRAFVVGGWVRDGTIHGTTRAYVSNHVRQFLGDTQHPWQG